MTRNPDTNVSGGRTWLGPVPKLRTNGQAGRMNRYWLKLGCLSTAEPHRIVENPHYTEGVTHTMDATYTPDQIKAMFRSCENQAQLEHRLAALVAQYTHEQRLVQQFKSIAGQIKPTLPEKVVKESRSSGPNTSLKATRPADLDPAIWNQWTTLPVKVAQGNLSRWRTLLIRHDATGLDKSEHGEYRKGSDGKEYFYAAPKGEKVPGAPREKVTPEQEVSRYRAAQDKSGIELSSGAYDLLSRAERKVYAADHLARLAAKKAAKKAAATPEQKAEQQVTVGQAAFVSATAAQQKATTPEPTQATSIKRGTLKFV